MTLKSESPSTKWQDVCIAVADKVVLTVLVVSIATVLTTYFLWNHLRGKHEDHIP
jgi:hypothetical protein